MGPKVGVDAGGEQGGRKVTRSAVLAREYFGQDMGGGSNHETKLLDLLSGWR